MRCDILSRNSLILVKRKTNLTLEVNPMQLDSEVSKRIREIRISKGMSQEMLAQKADINSNFLGRVERGVSSNLQLKTLDKIISALEIDYPTFFSFNIETADKKTRIMNKLSLSSQQDEILDVIDSILDIEKNKNN